MRLSPKLHKYGKTGYFFVYDGYLFRKPDGIYFHSNETGEECIYHSFLLDGDVFSWMPEELLRIPDFKKQLAPDHFTTLRDKIHKAIANPRVDVEKFFFPKGVERWPHWSHALPLEFSYFIVIEEVWKQWCEKGVVEPRWWQALAYSAKLQGGAHKRQLFGIDPWMPPTFFRQIYEAKTKEEIERVIEIIRPRPAGETLYVREWPYGLGREPLQVVAAE